MVKNLHIKVSLQQNVKNKSCHECAGEFEKHCPDHEQLGLDQEHGQEPAHQGQSTTKCQKQNLSRMCWSV